MLGDEGTLILQEQHGLQSLGCAVSNDPATVQCAEAETALQRQSVRVLLPCRAVTGGQRPLYRTVVPKLGIAE